MTTLINNTLFSSFTQMAVNQLEKLPLKKSPEAVKIDMCLDNDNYPQIQAMINEGVTLNWLQKRKLDQGLQNTLCSFRSNGFNMIEQCLQQGMSISHEAVAKMIAFKAEKRSDNTFHLIPSYRVNPDEIAQPLLRKEIKSIINEPGFAKTLFKECENYINLGKNYPNPDLTLGKRAGYLSRLLDDYAEKIAKEVPKKDIMDLYTLVKRKEKNMHPDFISAIDKIISACPAPDKNNLINVALDNHDYIKVQKIVSQGHKLNDKQQANMVKGIESLLHRDFEAQLFYNNTYVNVVDSCVKEGFRLNESMVAKTIVMKTAYTAQNDLHLESGRVPDLLNTSQPHLKKEFARILQQDNFGKTLFEECQNYIFGGNTRYTVKEDAYHRSAKIATVFDKYASLINHDVSQKEFLNFYNKLQNKTKHDVYTNLNEQLQKIYQNYEVAHEIKNITPKTQIMDNINSIRNDNTKLLADEKSIKYK
jgi:hypothetical protein